MEAGVRERLRGRGRGLRRPLPAFPGGLLRYPGRPRGQGGTAGREGGRCGPGRSAARGSRSELDGGPPRSPPPAGPRPVKAARLRGQPRSFWKEAADRSSLGRSPWLHASARFHLANRGESAVRWRDGGLRVAVIRVWDAVAGGKLCGSERSFHLWKSLPSRILIVLHKRTYCTE